MGKEIILVIPHNKPFLGNQICQIPFFENIKKDNYIVSLATKKSGFVSKELKYINELIEYENGNFVDFFLKIIAIKKKYKVKKVYNFRRNSIDITLLIQILFKDTYGYKSIKKNIFSVFYKNKFEFDLANYIGLSYTNMSGKELKDSYINLNSEGNEILIIPGGSSEFKKYPIEKYLEIAKYCNAKYKVGFILGNDMKDEIIKLKQYKEIYNLYIGLELEDSRTKIKESKLVIANDCGPSHFAHIYDIPRISLFVSGVTHKHWFNQSQNSILLKSNSEDISEIDVNTVKDSVDKLITQTKS